MGNIWRYSFGKFSNIKRWNITNPTEQLHDSLSENVGMAEVMPVVVVAVVVAAVFVNISSSGSGQILIDNRLSITLKTQEALDTNIGPFTATCAICMAAV